MEGIAGWLVGVACVAFCGTDGPYASLPPIAQSRSLETISTIDSSSRNRRQTAATVLLAIV